MKKIAVLFWASLLAAAAVASEEHRTRIEIEIDDESGQSTFRFDSQEAGFHLNDMAVGERRQLVDDGGNVASILRKDEGFELDVGGRTIDLHDMGGEHEIEMHVQAGDADVVVDDVRTVRKIKMVRSDDAGAVTIISGAALDETTRQRIREVLQSSGREGEVVFIDGDETDVDAGAHANRKHEIRIIRKEVDVTD